MLESVALDDFRPPEGRLRALINAWRAGEPKLGLLLKFIDWMPIMFCPFGERWYYESEDRYGQETSFAPHNLMREPFHFLGGFALGNALGWLHPWVPVALVFSVMGYVEFFIGRKEGKKGLKALLDTIFWTAGAALPALYLKGW